MSVQKRYIEGLDFYRLVEFYKDEGNHLRCKITPNEEERMDGTSRLYIYAHYVEDELVYIGESSDILKRRMNYYCSHVGMTNVRVRKYFNEQFKRKPTSDICTFIHMPEQICISESVTINPYVAIEQTLINILKPKLNRKDVLKYSPTRKKPRKHRK
jgi:hypothetical protein